MNATHADQETRSMHARMLQLTHSFPALAGAPLRDTWDQHKLAEWARGGKSTGEVQAASFVLTVWSGGQHKHWSKLREFDLAIAISNWDDRNRAAFADWCANPFWP